MTAFPAQMMGLNNRGRIVEGMKADLTIFNPKTIIDLATFENPHQFSKGIEYVLVNGKLAVDETIFMPIKSGEVLKKSNGS